MTALEMEAVFVEVGARITPALDDEDVEVDLTGRAVESLNIHLPSKGWRVNLTEKRKGLEGGRMMDKEVILNTGFGRDVVVIVTSVLRMQEMAVKEEDNRREVFLGFLMIG